MYWLDNRQLTSVSTLLFTKNWLNDWRHYGIDSYASPEDDISWIIRERFANSDYFSDVITALKSNALKNTCWLTGVHSETFTVRRNTVRRSCAVFAATVLTAIVMNIVVFDSLTVLKVGFPALQGLRGSVSFCMQPHNSWEHPPFPSSAV